MPTLKDEAVQISSTGDGKRLRLGVAIETRLEPAVREAVFGALREVGCKNVEIECDDADQLVLFGGGPMPARWQVDMDLRNAI